MKRLILMTLIVLSLTSLLGEALAESTPALSEKVYHLYDEQGRQVTSYAGECNVGDEYISEANQHYRVKSVDEASLTAQLESLGEMEMPDVSWLEMENAAPVSASATNRRIALYCTHSDESYEKGDGTFSNEKRGGIYDIAELFAEKLEALGVTVERSDATHLPHDAGAYRRSRQTAIALLKNTPNAIFDLHRGGIPDPEEYATTIGNEKMSKVRLLVGRGNQNQEANLSLAKQIKAVADKVYPKLIKDIYMGKGSYNQDLSPRALLFEFGTYTLPKERVAASTGPMAEVVYKALYGGVTGAAGASDVSGRSSQAKGDAETADGQKAHSEANAAKAEDNRSAGSGIVWLIVALVVGLLIFALAQGGGMNKFKRSFSEMSGGLFGKKPPRE